jgi:hypothetical protein
VSYDAVFLLTMDISIVKELADSVVAEIIAEGGDALAIGGDVTAEDFPKTVINATIEFVFHHVRRLFF